MRKIQNRKSQSFSLNESTYRFVEICKNQIKSKDLSFVERFECVKWIKILNRKKRCISKGKHWQNNGETKKSLQFFFEFIEREREFFVARKNWNEKKKKLKERSKNQSNLNQNFSHRHSNLWQSFLFRSFFFLVDWMLNWFKLLQANCDTIFMIWNIEKKRWIERKRERESED